LYGIISNDDGDEDGCSSVDATYMKVTAYYEWIMEAIKTLKGIQQTSN